MFVASRKPDLASNTDLYFRANLRGGPENLGVVV